jgi:hypothetical protein
MNSQRPSRNSGGSCSIREIFSKPKLQGALGLDLANYDLRKDPFLL